MPVRHQDGLRGPETSDHQVQHNRHQAPPRGRRVMGSVPTHPTSTSLYASWCKAVSGGGGCHWQGTPPYHSTSVATNQGSLGFPKDIAMLLAASYLAFFGLGPASLRCHVSRDLTHLPTCHGATWQWMFRDSPV